MGSNQAHINAKNSVNLQSIHAEQVRQRNQQLIDTVNNSIDKINGVASAGIALWIDKEADAWHDACTATMGALFLADHYFNQVLSAQVKPSVFEAFLSGVTKAFLMADPEFAMIGAVLTLGKDASRERRDQRQEQLTFFKEGATEGVAQAIEAKEKGDQIAKLQKHHHAKTAFFARQVAECSNTAHWVSKKHYTFKLALLGHPTADFKTIEAAWNTVVGPAKCYDIDSGADDDGGTVIQAALLLLYDLLREYCEQCVSLTISIGGVDAEISPNKARSMVASGDGSIIEFDGLNSAQRKEMYDLFDQIDDLYGRPKIANYKDLVTNWFKSS
jgi:hypothetical protein